jgi:hypothetical protein
MARKLGEKFINLKDIDSKNGWSYGFLCYDMRLTTHTEYILNCRMYATMQFINYILYSQSLE